VSRIRPIDLRWNAIVNDFRRSGLTQADFCRQRNISLASFRYHFYKPASSEPVHSYKHSPASPGSSKSVHSYKHSPASPGSSKPARSDMHSPASANHLFLPVTILPDPIFSSTASQPHLELILSNGRRIAVAPGFDTQTLRRLIAAVEKRPCSD
jgi:hypothetical protein